MVTYSNLRIYIIFFIIYFNFIVPDTEFDINLEEASPENELFLLSILAGKTDMAQIFLKKKRDGSVSFDSK
jgi:hypothetical protein